MNIDGREIKIYFEEGGTNLADRYFDLDKFETDWHKFILGKYHVTVLLGCLKQFYGIQKYEIEPDLKRKCIGFIGNLYHNEIQTFLKKKDEFNLIEIPIEIEIDSEISIRTKIDIANPNEYLLSDIKTFSVFLFPKVKKDGSINVSDKTIKQIVIGIFILNHTYFKLNPAENIKVICVSKQDLETKPLIIEYNEDDGLFFYNQITEKAKTLHHAFVNDIFPPAEIHKWCKYCPILNICDEGKAEVEKNKEPKDMDSLQFKAKYPDKKAYYIKGDKWIKTKLYKEFLDTKAKHTKTPLV